jgi:hypothetical protein
VSVESTERIFFRSLLYENDIFSDDLSNTTFFQCRFVRVDFRDLELDSIKFQKCAFDLCIFSNLTCETVGFLDCAFTLCELRNSSFSQSELLSTSFQQCELKALRFESCSVRTLEFVSSMIHRIDFDQCQSNDIIGRKNLISSPGGMLVYEQSELNDHESARVTAETRETYTRLRVVRQYEEVVRWGLKGALGLSVVFLVMFLSQVISTVYSQVLQIGFASIFMPLVDINVLPWLIGVVAGGLLAKYVQTKLMIQKARLLRILDSYQNAK